MFARIYSLSLILILGLLGSVSCDRAEEYVEIKDSRTPGRFSPVPQLGLSFKDRAGITSSSNSSPESSKVSFFVKMIGPKTLIDGEKSRFDVFCKTLKVGKGNPPFEWTKPDEWNAVEGTTMRIANFNFGPDKKGECYFTVLPGGGQLLANLNRWRSQMGLPDATPEEAEALPSRQFLFGDGKYVEIEGSFKGFGASDAEDGYKMIGIIMPELQIGGLK
tara:strand:+ start:1052 stop:1708 length:657 start_codon:yes stop_codon:yes gene_type:complete